MKEKKKGVAEDETDSITDSGHQLQDILSLREASLLLTSQAHLHRKSTLLSSESTDLNVNSV